MAEEPEKDSIFAECRTYLIDRQLRALETIAAGVAHEFNNLLVAVQGYSQMALEDNMQDRDLMERAFKANLQAAKRGGEIVRRLQHFSHSDKPQWETVELNSTVEDVLGLWREGMREKKIAVETNFNSAPPISLDPALFCVAMLDILQNAAEAVAEREDPPRLLTVTTSTEDGEAVLRIKDNGAGMNARQIEQAKIPFFTTKGSLAIGHLPHAKGLGLSVADGIISTLGGSLDIHSEEGFGTEVRLAFPPVALLVETRRSILVVDDDPTIRRIFTTILAKANYEVVTAENGKEAMNIFFNQELDLILLDQMMPQMSGTEMLKHLAAIGRDYEIPPVVMITAGYSPEMAREALSMGAACCLAKPVNHAKLLFLTDLYTKNPGGASPARKQSLDKLKDFQDRILLAESDKIMLDVMETVLDRSGYKIFSVNNAADAVSATEDRYFDLILLDVLLGDNTPGELVGSLRLNNPYTPIMVTTPRLSHKTVQDCIKAGATQAIRRPLDLRNFLQEVSRLVAVFRENKSRQ
jgi:CheY-like chemotaxis protein